MGESVISAFAQYVQRARVQRATGAQHSGAADQQCANEGQQEQPGVRLPAQVEDELVEQYADQLAAERGEQAAGGAEQTELGAPRLEQQSAIGTERPQQRALANAFIEGGLQAGEQHGQAGGEDEQQYVFHSQRNLREDAAQLTEQRLDLQQCRRGEIARQLHQFAIAAGRQVEAGHVGGGHVL